MNAPAIVDAEDLTPPLWSDEELAVCAAGEEMWIGNDESQINREELWLRKQKGNGSITDGWRI